LKCKICSRQAQTRPANKYCDLHQKAYENLQSKFEIWKKASNTEWNVYLKQVAKNPSTGIWAKEVAENLLTDKE
jgi:hypothetical protein